MPPMRQRDERCADVSGAGEAATQAPGTSRTTVYMGLHHIPAPKSDALGAASAFAAPESGVPVSSHAVRPRIRCGRAAWLASGHPCNLPAWPAVPASILSTRKLFDLLGGIELVEAMPAAPQM